MGRSTGPPHLAGLQQGGQADAMLDYLFSTAVRVVNGSTSRDWWAASR